MKAKKTTDKAKIKRRRIVIILAVVLATVLAGVFLYFTLRGANQLRAPVSEANAENFGILLSDLVRAYETPSGEDAQRIEADLAAIRAVSENEYEIAKVISDHWQTVYMDPEYRLFIYEKDDPAELGEYGITNDAGQAIVILGYELSHGEMQPELISRCDAAADLARAFPEAVLICSGGATGKDNPEKHTEAGLMKAYLTENCGIDASRIYTDEKALTTVDNAIYTLEILQKHNIRNMTIVTSSYHQCRSQMLYRLMAEVYRQQHDYSVELVGNYNYDIESSMSALDDRVAIQGLAGILDLPKEVVRAMPPLNVNGTTQAGTDNAA